MKKFLRVTLTTIASLIGLVLIALITTSAINAIALNSEAANIEPYGEFVTVDDKRMNVTITGSGDETIVLLPGFGTAAPALDFLPLIDELAPNYRVIAVEPFGYGLSDGTDSPRTSANIVDEIHSALQSLDVEQYIVMGHSIAGIYGLEYVDRYRDEVTAFVGIDSSVPTQPGMDTTFDTASMQAMKALGLTRIMAELAGDPYAGLPYDAATKDQMKILSFRNSLSDTYVDEMQHIAPNFEAAQRLAFPKELPLLLFAQADNAEIDTWVALHEEQAAASDRSELVLLEAGHYLHHTESKQIAAKLDAFLAAQHASGQ